MCRSLLERARHVGTEFAAPGTIVSVETSNLGALMGIAGTLVFAAAMAVAGKPWTMGVTLASLPAYVATFWLNGAGWLRPSRHLLGTAFLVQVLAATGLLSTASGLQVMLLVGIPMAFLLFPDEERTSSWIGVGTSLLACFATWSGSMEHPVEVLSPSSLAAIRVFALLSTFGGLAFIVKRFARVLAQREAEQRTYATTDELTSLPNRRHILSQAVHLLAVAGRYHRAFSLVLIDIDLFKRVNDTVGHVEGDRLLRQVAGRMAADLRQADLVGRYGGEEFVLLLPETPVEGAVAVADRLRRRIADEPFLLEGGPRDITISLGVATLAAGETALLDEVLRRADVALYDAKHSGRNRVAIWRGDH